MNREHLIHWFLALLLLPGCTSCEIGAPLPECDYNVELTFYYNNFGKGNELKDYITTMTDYLYNEQKQLIDVATRTAEQRLQRRMNLPPGDYTLVSWGNLTHLNEVQPDGYLQQANPWQEKNRATAGTQLNTDRLHYARATFTVPPAGILRRRLLAAHAYLNLDVTVAGIEEAAGKEFTVRLEGTSSRYHFEPYVQFIAQGLQMYVPTPMAEANVPHVVSPCCGRDNGEIAAEFIAYRLTAESQPVISVWQGTEQVMRNVALKPFFDTMLIRMDTNECQEFHIRITVRGDNIYTQFVGLGDWIDGGSFG